ncbi:unnamed protein product, partial [Meganyctiphanes norvegica]
MEYDNEESIKSDESDYPQRVLLKSLYENFEVNVKEEIEIKEEPINIKSVDIGIYDEPIAFTLGSNLVQHELTHSEQKSYQCSICDKKGSQNCLLIEHRVVHTGGKPYQCSQCDKTFTHKSYLIIHQRVHFGAKPYQCGQCDKAFSSNISLISHQKTHP